MKKKENDLSISSWYSDIQIKGHSLRNIPESERTPEMCFVAIHYWGAALQYVPNKYKTYELCLDAVRHNTPVDEGCSALAFVPNKLRTYELCHEAIRHDYLTSILWESGFTVAFDYVAAINFVPKKLRTPELCFEAVMNYPTFQPGCFYFFYNETKSIGYEGILNSSKWFIKSLKLMGMPDKYNKDALEYFEKIKK
jgi:hypothetical protein